MFNFFKKDKKQTQKKLWQQFRGQKNSDDILIKKAKELAPVIIAFAAGDTTQLSKELKRYDDLKNAMNDKFHEISYEMVLFYSHLIDRVASLYLEDEKRKIFITNFFIEIRNQFISACDNEDDAVQCLLTFTDDYFDRQEEYKKYTMSADKDKGYKDYLIWEFGVKIGKILGSETDIIIITHVQQAVSLLNAVQLPELFQE